MKNIMGRTMVGAALALAAGCTGRGVQAAGQTYDFQDPKGLNSIVITLEAPLETANGLANGITGSVSFDPANPKTIKGKVIVDAKTLKFSNDTYTGAAQGAMGLETGKYPKIEFDLKGASNIKKSSANTYQATVTGDFTLHGVTRTITVPVTATIFPGGVKGRMMGKGAGDLLTLRSTFTVKRSDYGIKPPLPVNLLADTVTIRVSIAGQTPAK